jgi:CubicO group peptidase (beta-lactamase class C family)
LILILITTPIFAGSSLGAVLQPLIRRLMREGEVPGLSIVVIRHGEIQWHRAFGTPC